MNLWIFRTSASEPVDFKNLCYGASVFKDKINVLSEVSSEPVDLNPERSPCILILSMYSCQVRLKWQIYTVKVRCFHYSGSEELGMRAPSIFFGKRTKIKPSGLSHLYVCIQQIYTYLRTLAFLSAMPTKFFLKNTFFWAVQNSNDFTFFEISSNTRFWKKPLSWTVQGQVVHD